MIANLLPSSWREIPTADTFNQRSTNNKKVKTKDCQAFGKYPVIDQGQEEIAGFIDDENRVIGVSNPLVIFGDHTRIIKWVNHDFVPGADGIKILEAATFVNSRYFYYQLKSIELPDKGYSRHFKYLNESTFRVAPLAEQQQIAAKLDELLAQVDNIKTRLDAIPKILKRFRQSLLAAAVSGKLTEDWRINIGDSEPWNYGVWADILRPGKDSFKRGPFGSALKKDMFVDKGYKVYEQYCPINDDCSFARYYISSEKFEVMRTFEVVDFDFLISCSGVSLGRITQVPKNSEKGIINQALLRVRLDSSKYDDNFFKILFKSPSFQKALFDNSTGSAIPNLKGVKELKAMVVPLPKVQEQTEIVRRVEQLFTYADQIEQRVKDAQVRVNHLTQSTLAKAFRGELTADWREQNPDLISGENSAEALLANIQNESKKLNKTSKLI